MKELLADAVTWIATFGMLLYVVGCTAGSAKSIQAVEPPIVRVKKVRAVKGTLTKVTDGDTLHITINGVKNVIRIAFIDAPESFFLGKMQKYGMESKNNLIKLCGPYMGKQVEVTILGQDVHATRKDGLVKVGGVDVSTYQIRTGFAWVYPQYNRNPELPILEAEARRKKLGLWKERQPVAPWLWRKEQKQKRAA